MSPVMVLWCTVENYTFVKNSCLWFLLDTSEITIGTKIRKETP